MNLNGLTQRDWKVVKDIMVKANSQQLVVIINTASEELKLRGEDWL